MQGNKKAGLTGFIVLLLGFGKCLNALGAQILANALPVFINPNTLNIGFELTTGRLQRMAAVIAEHRLLAARITFGHRTPQLVIVR